MEIKNNFKKKVKNLSIGTLFLIITFFALYGSFGVIFGVKIKGINITDGSAFSDNFLEIKGNTKKATSIKINNREINMDKYGYWEDNLILIDGFNLIKIEAEDRFQNKDIKYYRVFFENKKEKVAQTEKNIFKNEDNQKEEANKEEIEKKDNLEIPKNNPEQATEIKDTENTQEDYQLTEFLTQEIKEEEN